MNQLHKELEKHSSWYAFWHQQKHHHLAHWVFYVLVATVFCLLIVDRIQNPDRLSGLTNYAASPPLPLTLSFTHPEALAQPTAMGRVIRVLYDFDGKLYSGYGDWNDNTGPIKICPFDPITASLTCEKDALDPSRDFLMRNEQVAVFETINGVLHVPSIDPGGGGNHEFAQRTPQGTWIGGNSPFGLIHVFDMIQLPNQGLWLFGSCCQDNAVAYHSSDNGLTWSAVSDPTNLNLPPTSTSNWFNRLYFGAYYKGKIYTQSSYYPNSRVYDPASKSWSLGPNLFQTSKQSAYGYGSQDMEFAGKLVYSTGYPGGYGKMLSFDGITVTDVFKSTNSVRSIISMQIYNGTLYALAHTRTGPAILRSANLVNWEKSGDILMTNESPSSMRILNGTVYLGTTNSNVYSTPMPGFARLK